MLSDHAHGFAMWVQWGQCLLFCCVSACTLDRAGLQVALNLTDSSATAELPEAGVEGAPPDAFHDASLIGGDASEWPEHDPEEPAWDAGAPPPEAVQPPVLDGGQPVPVGEVVDASLPDLCPSDGDKSGDVDTDGDGILDCNDECPFDREKVARGMCGCGKAEPREKKGPGGRRGEVCPER